MSRIIIEYSGWVEADPAELRFVKVEGLEAVETITGEEWMKLEANERDDYLLDTGHDKVEATSLDGEFVDYRYEVD
jgi:hypothetical protein